MLDIKSESFKMFPRLSNGKDTFVINPLNLFYKLITNAETYRYYINDLFSNSVVEAFNIVSNDTENYYYDIGKPFVYLNNFNYISFSIKDLMNFRDVLNENKNQILTSAYNISALIFVYNTVIEIMKFTLSRKDVTFNQNVINDYVLKYGASADEIFRKYWDDHTSHLKYPSETVNENIRKNFSDNFEIACEVNLYNIVNNVVNLIDILIDNSDLNFHLNEAQGKFENIYPFINGISKGANKYDCSFILKVIECTSF